MGYVLARRLEGEFGRAEPALRLEVIGVRPGAQRRGAGNALLGALEAAAREHGILELRTQAAWNDHDMLRFLDHAAFNSGATKSSIAPSTPGAWATSTRKKCLRPSRIV